MIYTTWELPVTSRPHDTRIGRGRLDLVQPFQRQRHRHGWIRRPVKRSSGGGPIARRRGIVRADRRAHADGTRSRRAGSTSAIRRRKVWSSSIRRPRRSASGSSRRRRDDGRLGRRTWTATAGASAAARPTGSISRRGRVTTVKGSRPLGRLRHRRRYARTTCTARAAAARTCGAWTRRRCRWPTTTFRRQPRGVGGLGGGMRRGITDAQDRLWWGGYDGNFVGMLDPRAAGGQGDDDLSDAVPVVLPL